MKKLKTLFSTVTVFLLTAPVALAGEPVTAITPEDFTTKLKDLFVNVGMPLGSVILVGSLIIIAVKMMTASGSQKKAEAMEGLFNVAIGGVILGAALFFAGFLLGVGKWLAGQ